MTSSIGLLRNRFERYVVGPGVCGWIYEYSNLDPLPIATTISTGLEFGVQLEGQWSHRGSRTGRHWFTPGTIHTISPDESFDYSFAARERPGVQVGFALYPLEMEELRDKAGLLEFSPCAVRRDARMYGIARALTAAAHLEKAFSGEELRRELVAFIRRHAVLRPTDARRDAIRRARLELERHLDRPLYLEHLADVAGMTSTTFSRAFAQELGVTPARFRVELRLNEAVRLSWSRPDLSIRAIAERVGFEDLAYFHRVFRAKFRLTPAQIGRRVPAPC